MAAKLYKDLTPAEQKARDAELTEIVRGAKDVGAGIVKEEVFGIPGMFADLSGLAQYVTNPFTYGTSEKLQTASEDLIGDLGASALAAKAGVELSDEIFDEQGNIRPEMVGRMLAPGALYAKGAALAPGIGKLFAKATKTRGSGTEVKGSGNIEMDSSPSDLGPIPEAPTTVAPKKEVLEGEVVGTKSKKYMKLEKEMGEARTPELRAARELNMETQGVEDAFDLNAASNIDKNFDFASGGDEVRATSDDFIGGVIDEYQGARDQGFNRGDALVDAVRVKVNDYNEIYPDALDLNSVLDDVSRNVNDDFGFDQALGRFREGQSNRKALEAELQTAKFKNVREAQEAATRVREEQLGIADLSDAEKAAFYRNMGEQEQRGIVGAGIPDPDPPKPNLRLVKKAKGGPVDMRSGIGDLFKVYS